LAVAVRLGSRDGARTNNRAHSLPHHRHRRRTYPAPRSEKDGRNSREEHEEQDILEVGQIQLPVRLLFLFRRGGCSLAIAVGITLAAPLVRPPRVAVADCETRRQVLVGLRAGVRGTFGRMVVREAVGYYVSRSRHRCSTTLNERCYLDTSRGWGCQGGWWRVRWCWNQTHLDLPSVVVTTVRAVVVRGRCRLALPRPAPLLRLEPHSWDL
jgi:hypothetical protein